MPKEVNAIKELGVKGDIRKFRDLLPYDRTHIKNFNHLSEKGIDLLLYGSSYYSLKKRTDKKCTIEIKLLEFVALTLSNIECKILITNGEISNGFILEGTNLYFNSNTKDIKLHFLPKTINTPAQLKINFDIFPANIKSKSLIIDGLYNIDNSINILPNIEGTILYFKEAYSDNSKIHTYSLIDNNDANRLTPIIQNCFNFIKNKDSKIPLDFIYTQLRYISITEIHEHESSADPRNAKGVITINFREDLLISNHEKTAWVLHGLVHEAKHLQFFDLFIGQNAPSINWIKHSDFQLTNDWGIRIPCAWRGTPSLRSMADHLLALQAFIPGIISLLDYLTFYKVDKLSIWLRDHIELELRVINGAMGSLILGREYLTKDGWKLFSILQHDYHKILIPLLEKIDFTSKY